MWIYVKLLTGKTFALKVESCNTIGDLKATIEDMEGIRTSMQRFICAGRVLGEDWRTLADYNIPNKSTIHMVLRLGGAPQIYVKTCNGNTISVKFSRLDTVHNVKAQVEEYEGIPLDKQSLFFAGKQLEDTHTLYHYGIRDGSSLRVVQLSDATMDEGVMDDEVVSDTASQITSSSKANPNPNTYEAKLKVCAQYQAKATEVINELISEARLGASSSGGTKLEDLRHQMATACCRRKELEATVSRLTHKNKVVTARCASYERQLAALEAENKKNKLELIQGIEQGKAFLEDEKAKWLKSVEFLDHLTEGALQYFNYGFDSCQKQAEQQGFVGKLNKDAALQEAPELKGCEPSDQP